MLRYLLLARTGSGRTYFQKKVEEQGIDVARSYTTRPQRDTTDCMHHFIEDPNAISNRLLETKHDGYDYFYTMDELMSSRVIPIDPEHIEDVCKLFPNDVFRIIEIMASNEDRIKHCVTENTEKAISEQDEFIARCEEENDAFSAFEDAVTQSKLNINHIYQAQIINNDFTENADMIWFAKELPELLHQFGNARAIIEDLKIKNMVGTDENDSSKIMVARNNNRNIEYAPESIDAVTEQILLEPEGLSCFVKQWLRITHRFDE